MALVVQKYGGSSVADADRIRRVAERIVETKKAGNNVVVVVSAMGNTTDALLDLAVDTAHAAGRAETIAYGALSPSPTDRRGVAFWPTCPYY